MFACDLEIVFLNPADAKNNLSHSFDSFNVRKLVFLLHLNLCLPGIVKTNICNKFETSTKHKWVTSKSELSKTNLEKNSLGEAIRLNLQFKMLAQFSEGRYLSSTD